MSNLYDGFTNLYSLSKTLRFELIPVKETKDNFINSGLLEEDEHRADSYKLVKGIIDEYHKAFIERSLENFVVEDLDKYYSLYVKTQKTDKDKREIQKLEQNFRKSISKAFKSQDDYKIMFSKDLIEERLIEFVGEDEEKLAQVREFHRFTTYFKGFFKNRENIYDAEEKSTAISYRLINDNLPRFIDNLTVYSKAVDRLSETAKRELHSEVLNLTDIDEIGVVFTINGFNNVLTQQAIDTYNSIIGIFNKHINLHDQIAEKNNRIGKMTLLHKQILSDRVRLSFIPEAFETDQEVIGAVVDTCNEMTSTVEGIKTLLASIGKYDLNRIYIKNDNSIANISSKVYKDWSKIYSALKEDYDKKNLKGKFTNSYEKTRDNYITKTVGSYSIGEIERLINDEEKSIVRYFSSQKELFDTTAKAADTLREKLKGDYTTDRKLQYDKERVAVIKRYLDSVLEILHLVKPLLGNGDEPDKDNAFYSELNSNWDVINEVIPLYNKVRNYVTQKPYSTEKIKLNFGNPQLLDGWPVSLEQARSSLIFRDDNYYYLGIMSNNARKEFTSYNEPINEEDIIYKMYYLQAADPQKDVQNLMVIDGKTQKKNGRKNNNDENVILEELKDTYLPADINEIRKRRSYSKGSLNFSKSDLVQYIDYYKARVEEYFDAYNFDFLSSEEYEDFGKFTEHVNEQAYQLQFKPVSKQQISELVKTGKLYLFKIYNKDFSEYSRGTPNMHTLYWKALFDEKNLDNVVYKLNGKAEVFYRKASIADKDKVVHKRSQPIDNKNPNSEKKSSTFDYDIIKDRRYTVDKFQLHVPIDLNFGKPKAKDVNINEAVRYAIKHNDNPCVIGIDRGERHLLYIVVINADGEIIEQRSLNEIVSGNSTTNYQQLLDQREKDRDRARKDWQSIEGIKELKEGYLSQVIHEITKLMVEHNAIVVLEDLNFGFMRSRQKVEKQVYQKFEKMLINKLNYLVNKKANPDTAGGLLHAYQLTDEFKSFAKLGKQSGMLFYIPAWMTSKMDPTTGFVNLFYTKYESVDKTIDFWKKFESIKYNSNEDYFEFAFDYNNFTTKAEGTKTDWVVCSFGERVRTFRNPDNNGEWDNENVDVTKSIIKLFDEYQMDYREGNLIEIICDNSEKDFQIRLLSLFKLILQMRNSITGTDVDFLISPVKNAANEFYQSDKASDKLPQNADANGAYNIARKGQWVVNQISDCEDENLRRLRIDISNKEWLRYAQEHQWTI